MGSLGMVVSATLAAIGSGSALPDIARGQNVARGTLSTGQVAVWSTGIPEPESIVPSEGDYPPGLLVVSRIPGAVYHISPDGTSVSVFATGLAFPTGAGFVPDGFIAEGPRLLVTTQFGEQALMVVHPDGGVEQFATLTDGQRGGHAYLPIDIGGPNAGSVLVADISTAHQVGYHRGAVHGVNALGEGHAVLPYIGKPVWSPTIAPVGFGRFAHHAFFGSAFAAEPSGFALYAMDVRSEQFSRFVDVALRPGHKGLRQLVFSPTGWAAAFDDALANEPMLLVSFAADYDDPAGNGSVLMFDSRAQLIAEMSHGPSGDPLDPRGMAFVEDAMFVSDYALGRVLRTHLSDFQPIDCNGDSVADISEITADAYRDCDGNGVLDECELGTEQRPDCDANGTLDVCDIANGTSRDENSNGVPDSCELVVYVRSDAREMGTGESWHDAFTNLQDALAHAESLQPALVQVWVASGTYRPTVPGGNRSATFELVGPIGVYGGFAGDEIRFKQRDPSRNVTILSGDLNGDDALGGDASENSYHVVTVNAPDARPVLDGFVITGGNADGELWDQFGAGLDIRGGSPSIVHCVFTMNTAMSGGAIASFGHGEPTITGCSFRCNTADVGGAIHSGDPLKLTACTFYGNRATIGGAIDTYHGYRTELVNCVLSGNSASYQNGAISATVGELLLRGSVVYGNTAWQTGGIGGKHPRTGTVTLADSILWDNTDALGNSETSQLGVDGLLTVNHTCVKGLTGTLGGRGNIGDAPRFVDPDGLDDIPGTEDDNLRLQPGSPCIDNGNPFIEPTSGVVDLDGHPRVLCGRLDMGAYEFGIGDFDCDQTVTIFDFAAWESCMTGPGAAPYDSACEAFDFNADGDVDLADFRGFQSSLSAP